MKRARRMFKQIDCDNLPQTTKRMVAEAFASPKAMYLGHHGGGGEDPNSREGKATIDSEYLQCDQGVLRLDFVNFHLGVPPVCSFAMPFLPNFHQPKQNWADRGTNQIKVNKK